MYPRGSPRALAPALALSASLALRAGAQDTRNELWPEIDLWVRPTPQIGYGLLVGVHRSRESAYTQSQVGAHVDYRATRHVSTRAGYRYLWTVTDGTPRREHRPVLDLSLRAFPGAGIVVTNRNRAELRILDGDDGWRASWRYRVRLRAERTFRGTRGRADRALTPYAMEELGYDSRYDTFNRSRFTAGVVAQLTPRVAIDLNYVRQDDSRASYRHVNALGTTLTLTY